MKQPPFRASTMKGLYAKVVAGKFDPVSSMYSQDFKDIIRSCLQVRATDRPTCDKILAMPGLLNHLTGTLEEIDQTAVQQDESETLLKTIKMPRKMGQITERLPAPQYNSDKQIKRTNSLPTTGSRLMAPEGKKAPTEGSLSNHSSPNSKDTPKSRGQLAYLANRAQRNMDLDIIVENGGNEEEETLRTNNKLYRPPQRSALSRDSSVQRKNRGIIANAGIAHVKAGQHLSNLPPNYKAHNYISS